MTPKIANYPFLGTRKRKRFCLIATTLVCLLFIIYQFIMYYMVSTESPFKKPYDALPLVRGIHFKENDFYKPIEGKFTCIKSGELIAFSKINDDYCDCADGSDEPGTSACSNGVFYCTYNKNHQKMIPSSKVNDGICDCCDGSEEYNNNESLIRNFDRTLQAKTRHFLVPCPNTC